MHTTIIDGLLADIDGVRHGQVVIENGTIVAVGANLAKPDYSFSDHCLIFAGMGDIHIHAREDVTGRDNYKETFAAAAAAALHGGVVHVADMPNNPAAPIDETTYAAKERLLLGQNLPVTFTLYAGIGPGTRPLCRDVPYKAYMGPSVGELFFSTLEQLDEVLAHYAGRAVSFHCEDPVLLDQHKHATTHEQRRPPECELSATRFALAMIEKHRLTGKLCHYSVGEGLPLIRAAKAKGLAVTAEVTPHHVFFDTAQITVDNRQSMQMNPPLRAPSDRAALLDALREGTADYLATDHAPHTRAEKAKGISGQPHLDTYGPFVTWLLVEQGFAPQRVASICSANPGAFVKSYQKEQFGALVARLRWLAHGAGLEKSRDDSREDLRTRCGWSPFEGVTFPGRVAAVFVRGELMNV